MSDAATLTPPRMLPDQSRRTALSALAVAAACSVLFATVWDGLREADVLHADERAVAELRHHAVASVTGVAQASSFVGGSQMLALLALTAAAWLAARRRMLDAMLVLLALGGAKLLNAVLKNGFERPRPSIHDPLDTAAGFSFPSGHAMASMALFATLAFVLTRGRSAPIRFTVFGMAAALVGAIGLSRVYLGVHFPSDVAAGWSAGLAWAAVTVLLSSLVRSFRELGSRPAQVPAAGYRPPTCRGRTRTGATDERYRLAAGPSGQARLQARVPAKSRRDEQR
jgi:membrane-associated phospholipid phosphatase